MTVRSWELRGAPEAEEAAPTETLEGNGMASVHSRIRAKCDGIASDLIESDAPPVPAKVFCRGKASDLLRVRIDGQLSCIANCKKIAVEGEVRELIRSLVLLLLVIEDEGDCCGNT